MKKLNKALSILLIFMLTLTFATSVNAAGTNKITIENAKTGHTYSAYQIFKGTLSAGTLTDIDWGNGVDGNALLTELKKEAEFSSVQTAEDVAEVVGTFGNDSEALDNFASIVSKFLTSAKNDSVEGEGIYTISGLDDGYYFIKDSFDTAADSTDAFSKYIIKVAGANVSLKAKVDLPTLTKTVEGATYNNAAIGDDVSFKLVSKVPEMDGYDNYTFTITDDISAGFTMNDDMVVKIGDTTLSKGTDYEVSQTGNIYTINFLNMINQKANAGQAVEVTYTAELNEDANVGKAGNRTNAFLTYSNDPYSTTNAVSIDTFTYTYTTGLRLIKVASKDNTQKLENAVFEIRKEGNLIDTVTTDSNGEAEILGLAEGTYVITEIQAPEGYNTLKNDIEIEISFVYPTDISNIAVINSTITTNSNNSTITTDTDGIVELTIPNVSGLQLPSTGGVGTVIFIVGGLGLMIIAVIAVTNTQKTKKTRKY